MIYFSLNNERKHSSIKSDFTLSIPLNLVNCLRAQGRFKGSKRKSEFTAGVVVSIKLNESLSVNDIPPGISSDHGVTSMFIWKYILIYVESREC